MVRGIDSLAFSLLLEDISGRNLHVPTFLFLVFSRLVLAPSGTSRVNHFRKKDGIHLGLDLLTSFMCERSSQDQTRAGKSRTRTVRSMCEREMDAPRVPREDGPSVTARI
jgi:hypothetical protein